MKKSQQLLTARIESRGLFLKENGPNEFTIFSYLNGKNKTLITGTLIELNCYAQALEYANYSEIIKR